MIKLTEILSEIKNVRGNKSPLKIYYQSDLSGRKIYGIIDDKGLEWDIIGYFREDNPSTFEAVFDLDMKRYLDEFTSELREKHIIHKIENERNRIYVIIPKNSIEIVPKPETQYLFPQDDDEGETDTGYDDEYNDDFDEEI